MPSLAITNGSGGSVLFPIRAPRMINKSYKPAQGTFEGLYHYSKLIEDLAGTAEISTPLFRLSTDLLKRGIDSGLAEHDVAAIIEVIREISSEEKGKPRTKRSA